MSRKILLLLFLTIVVTVGGSAQSVLPTPNRSERLRLFDQVWQAVYDNYYDPMFNGVDWRRQRQVYRAAAEAAVTRAELYAVMRRMLGELADAHTRIYAPEEGFDRYRPAGVTVGVTVRPIEGLPTVSWVEPASEAERQGVRPGLRVRQVGGRPVAEVLDRVRRDLVASSTATSLELQSYDRLFTGPRATSLIVGLEDELGRDLSVTLTRRFVEYRRRVISRMLPHRIGYIEITGFGPEIEHEFDEAMAQMEETRGLIIDLRNNGGGFVNSVLHVAGFFLPAETDLGRFITRRGRATPRRTAAVDRLYQAPLVLLVSSRSASGAEIFAAAMQEQRRALVVGSHQTTCGCLLGVSQTIRLDDGGRLNVSDTNFLTAAGQRIEGAGVRPDHFVELRLRDLRTGQDRQLNAAVDAVARHAAFGERHRELDFSLEIPPLDATSTLQNWN